MTFESLAADIVDRIHNAPQENKLNLTLMVRDLIRKGLHDIDCGEYICQKCGLRQDSNESKSEPQF